MRKFQPAMVCAPATSAPQGCNSNGYRLTPQRPRPLTVHSTPNAHINLVTPQFPRPFTTTYTAHNTPEQRPHEQRCRCQLAAVAAHGVSDSSSQGERNGDVDGLSTHGALQGANGARGKGNAVRREGRLTGVDRLQRLRTLHWVRDGEQRQCSAVARQRAGMVGTHSGCPGAG